MAIFFAYLLFLTSVIPSYSSKDRSGSVDRFDLSKDLLLVHYDFKTDIDDLHSAAAFATLLADKKYSNLNWHAVAGTYGIQEGLYVPPNKLMKLAFGSNWSDANEDFDGAVRNVSTVALETLRNNGSIWIADGGQSDFSASLVKEVIKNEPNLDISSRVHIIQHSNWNEEVTHPDNLAFVKKQTDYHKIPDGNAVDNGTPGFRSDEVLRISDFTEDERLLEIWDLAVDLGNQYNGVDDRYLNESVKAGGLDFSDFAEVCWILGLNDIRDSKEFFTDYMNQ